MAGWGWLGVGWGPGWQNIRAIIQFGRGGGQELGTPLLQGDQMNLLQRQDRLRFLSPLKKRHCHQMFISSNNFNLMRRVIFGNNVDCGETDESLVVSLRVIGFAFII